MKQYTIRLDDEQAKTFESMMKKQGFASAQKAFEFIATTYQSVHDACEYWETQHDHLSAEYADLSKRSQEKIELLKGIIERGLGSKIL